MMSNRCSYNYCIETGTSSSWWWRWVRHSVRHDKPRWKLEIVGKLIAPESGHSWGNANYVGVMISLRLAIPLVLRRLIALAVARRTWPLLPAFVCLHTSAYGFDYVSKVRKQAILKTSSPFDDTPAPISMSGSSATIPDWISLPPVPPYSAVSIHLRSASVKRSIGMILIPV